MAKRRHASLARFGGAATGVGGIVTILPDLAAAAWIQSRLVFFIAAAYGYDPYDPMRPAELLVIRELYPDPQTARRALDGVGTTVVEAYAGSKLQREEALAARLARFVGRRMTRRIAGRLIPFAAIAFNAIGNERETRALADKAIKFYGAARSRDVRPDLRAVERRRLRRRQPQHDLRDPLRRDELAPRGLRHRLAVRGRVDQRRDEHVAARALLGDRLRQRRDARLRGRVARRARERRVRGRRGGADDGAVVREHRDRRVADDVGGAQVQAQARLERLDRRLAHRLARREAAGEVDERVQRGGRLDRAGAPLPGRSGRPRRGAEPRRSSPLSGSARPPRLPVRRRFP